MKYFAARLLLFCSLLLIFTSCHKNEDKATRHKSKIKVSRQAVTIDEDSPFDFTIIDTANFYYGEVGDNSYFFKVDKITQNHLAGRYYAVNEKPIAESNHFDIEYKNGNYIFSSKGKEFGLKFAVTIDTAAITGVFNVRLSNFEKQGIAFEKYRDPKFTQYESKRYASNCPENYLEVEVEKDITYGKAKGYWTSMPTNEEKIGKLIMKGLGKTAVAKDQNLTLDLYLPKDSTVNKRPLLVLIHGGAFYVGDKGQETMTTWCNHFSEAGYVVASINYRMGFNISKASIQKCGYCAIQDAHAAIRYLVAHADKYGIDPNYIFLGGTSAGSITALGVTFMTNATRPSFVFDNKLNVKLGNIESSGNDYTNKFKIKALANMWGAVYDLDELNGHNTPVISFHGTEDNLVPFNEGYPFSNIKGKLGEMLFDKMYGSQSIHHRLDSLHIRNEFHPIEGVSHAPYQDKKGHPNDCYYFIQEKMQQFFYVELMRVKGFHHEKNKTRTYTLQQDDIQVLNWKVDGGFLLDSDNKSVTVLWRKDARHHKITVSGLRANGMAYNITESF